MTENPPLKSLEINDRVYETFHTRKYERRRPYVAPDPKKLRCVIPGVILKIHVHASKKVMRGEPVMVLEAMKMQNDILSPVDGRVKTVLVTSGQMVMKGDLLIEYE
jgi:biotin carboxyl carrier protein